MTVAVQPGDITCPKCGEDRPTLITEVIDPMGRRFYCCVCACVFVMTEHEKGLNAPPIPVAR